MKPPYYNLLQQAQTCAQSARFIEMLAIGRQIIENFSSSVDAALDVGALFLNFGYLTHARKCFERARMLAPNDLRAIVNLANVARDAGNHHESKQWYADLLKQAPNHPVIRRNLLTSLEYDPASSDAERLAQARAWGRWAIDRAGGIRVRPVMPAIEHRPLRIGYVSADFCQHTVGLFVKDVITTHDRERVMVFAYSAGQVKDWVTDAIMAACQFRDVAHVGDTDVAALILQDKIDILVDLSGHTAGSRLTVFAYRPAPVLVSWLGYFATTGLPCMDAVLLDGWHAPEGFESKFTESIIRLAAGRFCYQPVPYAPEIASSPCQRNGHITFGCFNNTAKLNEEVLDVWARILSAVPDSRLILKWRTFNDDHLREQVTGAFVERGIAAHRIELRGPSFHADLLKEYADIDIALDPFPFTGGLTSCEALWMGIPIVTWPQSRVVSRQTFAILSAIGLPELAAQDAEDYVRIAAGLACNQEQLRGLRGTLREKMQQSPLCDVTGFTRTLEEALHALYHEIVRNPEEYLMQQTSKTLLHVGAGHPESGAKIPSAFHTQEWREVRLDIDPVNEPDILGSMLDMSAVADESVDAIFSAHNIEHLYHNEIPVALREFLRVLRPDGFVVINCPDLQAAAQMIAEDRMMDVAYNSPAGPVTPYDIVFSHRLFTGRDKPFMAHHSGFTLKVLMGTVVSNGFLSVGGKRRPAAFDLWVVATKMKIPEEQLRVLAEQVLPAS